MDLLDIIRNGDNHMANANVRQIMPRLVVKRPAKPVPQRPGHGSQILSHAGPTPKPKM